MLALGKAEAKCQQPQGLAKCLLAAIKAARGTDKEADIALQRKAMQPTKAKGSSPVDPEFCDFELDSDSDRAYMPSD